MDEALHQWQQINRDQCGLRQNAYGMVLAKKRDFDGAIKAWTEAAHNFGYAKAYYNLGICHEQGLGVEQNLEEVCCIFIQLNFSCLKFDDWVECRFAACPRVAWEIFNGPRNLNPQSQKTDAK